ncbi:MAG: Maf family nucleotide pyrophosphatase [Cruoricaptor ignavus]|nr:Maf family nucleotide pyrophosphatase [Cruoricaptor ignavus]
MNILLASQSPRRKELLASLGFDFQVVSIDCEEVYPPNLEVEHIAVFLSELKANAYKNLSENDILITADTIVALDKEILGKPKNKSEAKEMLRKLSGQTHQVYTGITIRTQTQSKTLTDVAHVECSNLNDAEIDDYIYRFQPMDKAGSYGIQEWLGMAKITKINGSFYTIMGLPTHLIYEELKRLVG